MVTSNGLHPKRLPGSPLSRLEAISMALGCDPESAVGEIAKMTGCKVNALMEYEYIENRITTQCGLETVLLPCKYHQKRFEYYQGDIDFWLGVAAGVMQQCGQGMY